MTRYSNPLPHNGQVPPNQVPPSQGRPAGAGQPQQPGYAYPPHAEPEPAGWPAAGQPRTAGRPATHGYTDPAYGGLDTSAHADPYAALRPDGYGGYGQPSPPVADPYGLAGYTAPQPRTGFGTRQTPPQPQQPAFDAFGGASDPYAHNNSFGFGGQPAAPAPGAYGAAKPAAPAPQAPSFESFGAQPSLSPQPQTPQYAGGFGAAPQINGYASPSPLGDQWSNASLGLEPRDYDAHGYGNAGLGNSGFNNGQGQWSGDGYGDPQVYGDPQMDPALAQQAYAAAPQAHGSFDQSYAEDEPYEEEPRRSSWKKVAVLVASMVVVGGGLTFAYSSIMGPGNSGPTPVVKGATGPAKVKPSEPGGKQFAHADSKIMGRLGEGPQDTAGSDANGVRKVPVVVVGRDGSIQPPPAAAPESDTRAVISVPGLTVIDGLNNGGPSPSRPAGPSPQQQQKQAASPPVQMVTASEPERPVVVAPPQQPKKASNLIANAATDPPAAVQTKVTAPKKERVAAAAPVVTGPKPTGAGYVAVLASVPASNSSRIDALKQFADMQQKYGTILQNKTPDVQEANLGEKGTYHRLLVGPPGSRDAASSVCTQLKAEGYSGCWVTAY
jgi:hypothetical protein